MPEDPSQVAAPRSLTALPPEILHQICYFLCDHCSGNKRYVGRNQESDNSLAALCRTSRCLAEVSRPYLYHAIGNESCQLFSLLRTLAANPDLAAHIRSFIFEPDCFCQRFHDIELGWLMCLADRHHMIDFKDSDLDELWQGSILNHADFAIELLIILAVNLETIEILLESDFTRESTKYRYLDSCLARAHIPGSSPLSRIRNIKVTRYTDSELCLDSPRLETLLRIAAPTLEQLFVEDTFGSFHFDGQEALPHYPNLRHVLFDYCTFDAHDPSTIGWIKLLCTNSPRLEATHFVGDASRDRSWQNPPQITRMNILSAILPCSSTLRSITLDFSESSSAPSLFLPAYALTPFFALEELRVEGLSFCQHRGPDKLMAPFDCLTKALPSSIKTLILLMSKGRGVWHDVLEFAQQVASGQFPKMRRLRIYAKYMDNNSKSRQLDAQEVSMWIGKIEEAVQPTGIDFEANAAAYSDAPGLELDRWVKHGTW